MEPQAPSALRGRVLRAPQLSRRGHRRARRGRLRPHERQAALVQGAIREGSLAARPPRNAHFQLQLRSYPYFVSHLCGAQREGLCLGTKRLWGGNSRRIAPANVGQERAALRVFFGIVTTCGLNRYQAAGRGLHCGAGTFGAVAAESVHSRISVTAAHRTTTTPYFAAREQRSHSSPQR